ncbi:MAG: F0F1 ATP synthase subunit A [Bacteroidota bacterium]|jgi:F-type H+-transporting ATPase subunit a|nr:F0F1 ATP synthase subunit A [Bacteroidota bacterium]OQC44793.1 MAG: ATP synthase subunit a [Bacteroidetes bacterium ADurb.Bin028]HNY44210.1 F0F1 ATP synthase subunit A [Bacteroidales bacterium]HOD89110.1 F0F1 ATP synthase subunit A [Bacteroidales bacterium]HOE39278.1 F0F1 ATP synthase subunit A [Bacteroidales bacterium]
MRRVLFISVIFASLLSIQAFASDAKQVDADEAFDIKGMIMHHLKDSHEWHILDYKKSDGSEKIVSIPLPIIVYANGKLDVFMSSKFEHGNKVVDRGTNKYILHHDKIYLADENGGLTTEIQDGEEKIMNATPLDISITKNVCAMIIVSIVILWIFISVAKAYEKRPGRPKGLQALMEPLILFVKNDIVYPNLGKKTDKFLPFLLTVFFFILFNNLFGIIPFFPGGANVTGNIAVTMTLATFTFLMINLNGNKHYWQHNLWMPGVPVFVRPILTVVEIMGMFVKPVALTIRLFANITAGHIIILSLVGLIFVFKSLAIAPVTFLFVLFMDVLELLVAFLQAYVFTMLSALFIGIAVAEPEH